MEREKALGGFFCVLVCISRVSLNVMTPLYLDCLNPINTILYNTSVASASNSTRSMDSVPVIPTAAPVWQRIDPFFGIWMSMGFDCILFGSIVLFLYACVPGSITERETSYPKLSLVLSGSAQAVSALLYQFSTSGSRTAPYLQGALGYFYVPIAFTLRYFILHKRPTLRKLICALIIVAGEIICLLPTMFPSMESAEAKEEDGGAAGIAGVLWPIAFVMSGVPHAVWNILLEKGAKDKTNSGVDMDTRRLNMAYIMFWNFFGTFITTLLLVWVDLIPGFGLMPNIRLFFPQFWFNLKCIFGAVDVCGFHQMFTAWGRIVSKTSMFVLVGLLVRYGEGANLYAIMVAVVNPMIFLVFTLIDEQTARWHPHASLSTWLSLGALAVMVPAVVLYNSGADEVTVQKRSSSRLIDEDSGDEGERDSLLEEPERYGTINDCSTHTET